MDAMTIGMTLGAVTLVIGTIGITAFILHLAVEREEKRCWPQAEANHQSEDSSNI